MVDNTAVIKPALPLRSAAARKPLKMPFLSSLAGAVDQLVFETEEKAKKIIQRDIAEAAAYRDTALLHVQHRLLEHSAVVSEVVDKLGEVMAVGDNSGDRQGNDQEETPEEPPADKPDTKTSDGSGN